LLIFVYDKIDDHSVQTGRLNMQHAIFVNKSRTADYPMTSGILQLLSVGGNEDDLVAFMQDKNLPVDDIEARNLAGEILQNPPIVGYLTISNALQWRLQYSRVIAVSDTVEGITRIR